MKKLFMICLCSLLLVGCGKEKVSNEDLGPISEEEVSGKFFEDQTIDTLEIQNFNIANIDGKAYISFNIKNTAVDAVAVEYVKVYLYSIDDVLLHETYGYVGGSLASGDSKFISVEVDTELRNVAKVSYERV